MACDPNTLLEQAKCLNACIPQQMMSAVEVSLLCQILDAGGGGGGGGGGVTSFNTRTGVVTLLSADVTGALGFTPAAVGSGVDSFNTRTGAVTLLLADVTALVDARYVLKSGDAMTGPLTLAAGAVGTPQLAFTAEPTTGLFRSAAGEIGFSILGTQALEIVSTGLRLGALSASWSSDFTTASDVFLERNGANALGLRNGTNPQSFSVYNTYSGAGANFEALSLTWNASVAQVVSSSLGTGTARKLLVGTTGAAVLGLETNSLEWFTLQTNGTLTGATGTITANTPLFDLSQIWNNAGVTFTAIKLNVTNSNSAAASLLIDLQVGAATKFNVDRTGNVVALGGVTVAAASQIVYSNRSVLTSPVNGNFLMMNAANTDFARLQFGGTTSAFPSIKRSAALLQTRLADDSAYCDFESRILRVATAFTVATLPAAGTQGRISYVTDALAPAFLTTVVGGGAIVAMVFDNGTNWVAV